MAKFHGVSTRSYLGFRDTVTEFVSTKFPHMLLEIWVQVSLGVLDKQNLWSLGVGAGYCFNLQDSLAQNILNQIPVNAKNLIQLDSLAGAHVVVLADSAGVQRPTYKDLCFYLPHKNGK